MMHNDSLSIMLEIPIKLRHHFPRERLEQTILCLLEVLDYKLLEGVLQCSPADPDLRQEGQFV